MARFPHAGTKWENTLTGELLTVTGSEPHETCLTWFIHYEYNGENAVVEYTDAALENGQFEFEPYEAAQRLQKEA